MTHTTQDLPKSILATLRAKPLGLGIFVLGFASGLLIASLRPAAAQTQPQAAPVVQQNMSRLIATGRTETLTTRTSFSDIVVGDPDIADAMPLTDRSFYIHGKKAGSTSVTIYDAQKNVVTVVDIEVGANTRRLSAELRRRIPNARIEVDSVNGHIMLSGQVADGVAVDKAMTIAKQFDADVINSLTVAQPQQVSLEVRFVETSRNIGKELGVKWDLIGNKLTGTSGVTTSLINSAPFGTVLRHFISGGTNVDVLIKALEDKGLARRLAEPNLIAMSGQSASFLAGGEFPFPVQGQQGQVSVQFKKFGVGLTFTPVVLSNGLINLKIEPEVSQIDTTTSIVVGGVTVPSLVVRRANTQVELRDGQSFAIAGLLQSTNSESIKQLPWAGDIPILGALFRSTAFTKNETELAIIVTPRLVRPAAPGQRLRSPLDATGGSSDFDRFVLGRQDITKANLKTDEGAAAHAPVGGHILDMNTAAITVAGGSNGH